MWTKLQTLDVLWGSGNLNLTLTLGWKHFCRVQTKESPLSCSSCFALLPTFTNLLTILQNRHIFSPPQASIYVSSIIYASAQDASVLKETTESQVKAMRHNMMCCTHRRALRSKRFIEVFTVQETGRDPCIRAPNVLLTKCLTSTVQHISAFLRGHNR